VEVAGEQEFEIEAFGKSYDATRGPRTLYDARIERLKA
jgi:4-methylaminobutanoate oxidase (formaldehyde-forming)